MTTTPSGNGLQTFSAQGYPVLADGVITAPLATADNLWVHMKIYAAGGENALHAHPEEDHAFFVLQGAAIFTDAGGVESRLLPLEGIMVPKRTMYRFQSDSPENLVMLRVGGAQLSAGAQPGVPGYPASMSMRLGADGHPLAGDSPASGTASRPIVTVPSQTFGAR